SSRRPTTTSVARSSSTARSPSWMPRPGSASCASRSRTRRRTTGTSTNTTPSASPATENPTARCSTRSLLTTRSRCGSRSAGASATTPRSVAAPPCRPTSSATPNCCDSDAAPPRASDQRSAPGAPHDHVHLGRLALAHHHQGGDGAVGARGDPATFLLHPGAEALDVLGHVVLVVGGTAALMGDILT